MTEDFKDAVNTYISIVNKRLENPRRTTGNYDTRNLIGATYAKYAFTESEIEYFYETYDELWKSDRKVEAYCLLRLVYGVLTKNCIEKLYREGHLLTFKDIMKYEKRE